MMMIIIIIIILTDFSKGSRIPNFIKIRGPVTAELFHTDRKPDRIPDGQTDRGSDRHGETNGRFSLFCKSA